MEKLVLIYETGDGCTWSATETLPFEYESVAKAEYDLFELWNQWKENHLKYYDFQKNPTTKFKGKTSLEWVEYCKNSLPPYPVSNIVFGGLNIDLTSFGTVSYKEPKILKLNDWFEQYKNENYNAKTNIWTF